MSRDRVKDLARRWDADTLASKPDLVSILVVCEPFALLCGVVDSDWLPALDERREVVRDLAAMVSATFVALQAALDGAVRGAWRLRS